MSVPSDTALRPDSSLANEATVLFRIVNRIAWITLNRPAALNALDLSMIQQIADRFEQCRNDPGVVAVILDSSIEKAFCAGGDVRALLRTGQDTRAHIEQFFVDEYRLDHAIHRFPKPVVAIMDGVTMGGGMGLSQGATIRIATERSKIAMPETRIGLVPDVGATHFLAVMPVEAELYVGLCGVTLNGLDAVRCGLADVCVPHTSLAGYASRLAEIDTDPSSMTPESLRNALQGALTTDALDVATAPIAAHWPSITEHFRADRTPIDIVSSLKQTLDALPAADETGIETGNDTDNHSAPALRAWLESTIVALTTFSPTMIEVTREALLRGRQMTLADSFRMEMGIVVRSIEEGDFREGVRAHLVDKDRSPKWQPSSLEEVSRERIDHFMTSPWTPDTHPLADLGRDSDR